MVASETPVSVAAAREDCGEPPTRLEDMINTTRVC
jgi:hypothetical protein